MGCVSLLGAQIRRRTLVVAILPWRFVVSALPIWALSPFCCRFGNDPASFGILPLRFFLSSPARRRARWICFSNAATCGGFAYVSFCGLSCLVAAAACARFGLAKFSIVDTDSRQDTLCWN